MTSENCVGDAEEVTKTGYKLITLLHCVNAANDV